MKRVTTWKGRFLIVVLGISLGLLARWLFQSHPGDSSSPQQDAGQRFI